MRQRTVLLIAPNSEGLPLTQQAWEQVGSHHTVRVVRDGEAALEYLLRQEPSTDRRRAPAPDVLVLDLPLPRLSGLEVVQRLKQDPRFHSLPIIALAPSGRAEDVSQAYRAGVNAYVQKPADVARFLDVLGLLAAFWLETVELPSPRALAVSAGQGLVSAT
jgi:CheY-like chemotaxis protein